MLDGATSTLRSMLQIKLPLPTFHLLFPLSLSLLVLSLKKIDENQSQRDTNPQPPRFIQVNKSTGPQCPAFELYYYKWEWDWDWVIYIFISVKMHYKNNNVCYIKGILGTNIRIQNLFLQEIFLPMPGCFRASKQESQSNVLPEC